MDVIFAFSDSMIWSSRAEILGVDKGEKRNFVVRDCMAGESLLM